MTAAASGSLARGGSGPSQKVVLAAATTAASLPFFFFFDKTQNLYTIRAQGCRCQAVNKLTKKNIAPCSHYLTQRYVYGQLNQYEHLNCTCKRPPKSMPKLLG